MPLVSTEVMTTIYFFIIMLMGIMPLLFSSNMEIMERLDMQRIKRHNEILQGNYMTFVEEIEPRPAINYLYQVKTLDDYDKEEILSRPTRQDKNEALLYKLKLKGPNAFLEFVAGLEIGQSHLAFILVKEGQ